MARRLITVLVGLSQLLAACEGCESAEDHGDAAVSQLGSGSVVIGEVRLAVGETLPAYTVEDLERKLVEYPTVDAEPPRCKTDTPEGQLVTMTDGRLLKGIVVAASGFTTFRPRKPRKHHLTLEGCRLHPSIIGAMTGDTLHLRNKTDYPFVPIFGPMPTMGPLQPGKHYKISLPHAGVESMMCSRQARCGRTDVVVMHHPVFGVTDEQGRFRIDDFPASETVKLSAWHPLFEEAETFVWVDYGKQTSVNLELEVRQRAVPDEARRKEANAPEANDVSRTPLDARAPDAP